MLNGGTMSKEKIQQWLESKEHEQLIGLLMYEYNLKELQSEMEGDIKAGEYKT